MHLAGRGVQVGRPCSGLHRWSSYEWAAHSPPGRLGPVRAESGSEASGQLAKPPCGPGLNEPRSCSPGHHHGHLDLHAVGSSPLGGAHSPGSLQDKSQSTLHFRGPLT